MTEEDDTRSERVQLNNCRYTPLSQEVAIGEKRRAADIAKKRVQQVRDSNERLNIQKGKGEKTGT